MIHSQALVSSAETLGLPRVKERSPSHSLSPSRFQSDALDSDSVAGQQKKRKDQQDVLQLDTEAAFSRPLRAGRNDVSFVSVGLLGSIGTLVDVGGARIGVTESAFVNQDYAQLMVRSGDEEWTSCGIHVPFGQFDGKTMAMLPVLTIRLDPVEGVFDVYSGARLAKAGIPYTPDEGRQQIVITAGSEGAWLTGLVQADDNPLYVDENANGVDDDFEQTHLGKLLERNASKSERAALVKEWRKMERALPPPALFVPRPRPDEGE